MKNISICILVALIAVAGTWAVKPNSSEKSKSGFVMTSKLFDGYEATKELSKKVKKDQELYTSVLDSLSLTISMLEGKFGSNNENVFRAKEKYQNLYTQMSEKSQKELDQSQAKIWQQINQYVGEYGKENGYSYIHGASGTGSMMYADSTLDITNKVLVYINKRYKDE